MIRRYDGAMVQGYDGAMVQGYDGTMVQGYDGTKVQLCQCIKLNYQIMGQLSSNSPFEEPVPPWREGKGDVQLNVIR